MSPFQEAKYRVTRDLLQPVLDLMKAANTEVENAEQRALQAEATLEALRPVWAQGWTGDSQAAQAATIALSELWELLQCANQTSAMARLRYLLTLERTA